LLPNPQKTLDFGGKITGKLAFDLSKTRISAIFVIGFISKNTE
jgi:hypothetical protein